jgi:G6PDH family F420-dependent oxidoreductase
MRLGYTLMTEQAGPTELVRHAAVAEQAGFDFVVISDFPWLGERGRSAYAWGVLGAVAQVTDRVDLMTCVTVRHHPAVVAQQAATIQLLSGDRFTLGIGAEDGAKLAEAVEIISGLFDGGYRDYAGEHFRVDSAKLWELPRVRIPLAIVVSDERSARRFAPVADAMIAMEPDAALCQAWDDGKGATTAKIGQLAICWDPDREAAIGRAHRQFATRFPTEDDTAATIPCGQDIGHIVDAAKPFREAGFTHLALAQIGGADTQEEFLTVAPAVLQALRAAS